LVQIQPNGPRLVSENDEVVSSSVWKSAGLNLIGEIMAKRKGRKPKTLKEKRAETEEKLVRILRIASMVHNINRNRDSRKKARSHVRKFMREFRQTRDKGERETLKFLIKDYQSSADKMDSFIKDDLNIVGRMLKDIKLNGVKKNGKKG